MSASAGLMRQALAQALHHSAWRSAFGRRLRDQPLMRNVLADLAIESEAATALALRLARAFDASAEDEAERAFARIATAVAKYQVCKRTPALVAEAMECLGGNGYVEESPLPRLYREAPVNAIWEGSGNVVCLDVLRASVREPASLPALLAELRLARGGDRRLDAWVVALEAELRRPEDAEARARRTVERLALALEGVAGFETIRREKMPLVTGKDQRSWIKALECANLAWVGEMVTRSALERRESRGQHYRDDYPAKEEGVPKWIRVSKSGDNVHCKAETIPFGAGDLIPQVNTR